MPSKPLPPRDFPMVDPSTGRITQVWYDYLHARERGVGNTLGGGSSSAVWFYGTGTPSNSMGLDGDFYMKVSGTSIIAFYVKQGGAW